MAEERASRFNLGGSAEIGKAAASLRTPSKGREYSELQDFVLGNASEPG
jgi:hypothetical protein